jgi:hypothetical protein
MALVGYSDSEGSDAELPPQTQIDKPAVPAPETASASATASSFTINKANPRKIQVKLFDTPTNGETDGEPAPKRPRIGGGGGGAFGGFNALLPAPKRDSDAKAAASKPAARKVFGLKTGAEPGFSREADAEMRRLFAEEDGGNKYAPNEDDATIPRSIPEKTASIEPATKGNPFMFKPLSVARGHKKKKPKRQVEPSTQADSLKTGGATTSASVTPVEPTPPPKKVSLFGMDDPETVPSFPEADEEDEIVEVLDEPVEADTFYSSTAAASDQPQAGQSLDFIASDLNLSKAERRQLFGRRGQAGVTATNVVNFNTDQEYAANEELRASGEQIQRNPVRSIAPGKHSLKQLVNAATGQQEALEESFATGRRNKKEAGNKYGW